MCQHLFPRFVPGKYACSRFLLEERMLLMVSGLATRNKRPLEPRASLLIKNKEAGTGMLWDPCKRTCVFNNCLNCRSVSARYSVKRLMHRRSARYSVKRLMHRSGRLAPNNCSSSFKSSDLPPIRSLTFVRPGDRVTANQCQSVNRSVVPLGCRAWSSARRRFSLRNIV